MVDGIYRLKNRILEHIERDAKELDRVNVAELGEFVDMVKDLAEAEKHCMEASYYKSVTDAMGSSGYDSMLGRQGYGTMRQGYGSEGQHMHGNVLDMLDSEYHNLSQTERMEMKNRVLAILGIK